MLKNLLEMSLMELTQQDTDSVIEYAVHIFVEFPESPFWCNLKDLNCKFYSFFLVFFFLRTIVRNKKEFNSSLHHATHSLIIFVSLLGL